MLQLLNLTHGIGKVNRHGLKSGKGRMHMTVDEPRHQILSFQINLVGMAAEPGTDLLVAADRHDLFTFNADRLRVRVRRIAAVDGAAKDQGLAL